MSTVHTPPEQQPVSRPLIFLGGPIQGAPDWQKQAIAFISAEAPDIDIASPRRPTVTEGEFAEDEYMKQVNWEHEHLAMAAMRGVTLFWLAAEAEHVPGRSYAQTTRFELGEAVTAHRYGGTSVVVGIEKGFTNARYLRFTIGKKAPSIPLCDTLEDTCRQAIALAHRQV